MRVLVTGHLGYIGTVMVPMLLRGCEADELISRFGKSRNTISQRFYRSMRKAAAAAGITW